MKFVAPSISLPNCSTLLFLLSDSCYLCYEIVLDFSFIKITTWHTTVNSIVSSTLIRKTKTVALLGLQPVNLKVIINNEMIQQSSKFNFLGFSNSFLAKKYTRFQILTTHAKCYTHWKGQQILLCSSETGTITESRSWDLLQAIPSQKRMENFNLFDKTQLYRNQWMLYTDHMEKHTYSHLTRESWFRWEH